jgi:transcriptional regulator with XRE-family HTH domain
MADTTTSTRWAEMRRLRLDRGLTLSALAEAADLSLPYVSQLESGTRKGSPTTVKRLADALGVPVAELGRT